MRALLEDVPHLHVYLRSTFGKEPFHVRLGYRKQQDSLRAPARPYGEPAAHEIEDA